MNEYYLLQNMLSYVNSISIISQGNNPDYTSPDVFPEILYDQTVEIKHTECVIAPQESRISFSEEKTVPLSIINGKSSLEAVVLYLKDFSGMKFNEIARLLNRDQRTIWATYSMAKKKKLVLDTKNNSQLMLPLNIFYSRNISVLENIVLYLRITYSLSFNQISDLIGKNYQTVRTVYMRAMRKISTGLDGTAPENIGLTGINGIRDRHGV